MSRGFTLIEVLVASFIMFLALTIFTSIYRSAMISTERATEVVASVSNTSVIVEKIAFKLRESSSKNQLNGTESLFGEQYTWRASVKNEVRPPPRYFGKELIQAEHSAKLWAVTVTLSSNGKQFSYEELTW